MGDFTKICYNLAFVKNRQKETAVDTVQRKTKEGGHQLYVHADNVRSYDL